MNELILFAGATILLAAVILFASANPQGGGAQGYSLTNAQIRDIITATAGNQVIGGNVIHAVGGAGGGGMIKART